MPSIRSFSKTSVLFAVIAGVILIGLAGYYAFKNGIFASTTSPTSVKNITVAFNNFPEGDTSTQAKYSSVVTKITPNKPGYRCTQKIFPVNVSTANANKSDSELIKVYRDQISTAMAAINEFEKNGVAFVTKSEFSSTVNRCNEEISKAGSDENAIKNIESCQYAVNSVIKESMKDKCAGLGEN